MTFMMFEAVEEIVVGAVRDFFQHESAVGSLINLSNYRWNPNPESSVITISAVWPDTERMFPAIRVSVNTAAHQELGFNQQEFYHYDQDTNTDYYRVGGMHFVSVNFVVGATSRLTMKRIADILDVSLVARHKVWSKLVNQTVIPIGNPILNFTGTSEEVLSSRQRIYKATFQYPKVRVEWYEDIGISGEDIEKVIHYPAYQ